MRFNGKVVLVTGAQTGLGAGFARAFGNEGASVIVNYLDDRAAAERVAGEAGAGGGRTLTVPADVASEADIAAMFAEIDRVFGRIDVLVNNAGIFPRVPALAMTSADWDRVLNVNLKGAFLCAQGAARRMVTGGGGAIVNISSGAVRGRKLGVHYTASKAGLIGMTRSLALELAEYGIRVNAVAPGLADTAQPRNEHSEARLQELAREVPLGRMAQPDDIAAPVLFLASDEARHVTGQTLHVNGGTYLW